MRQEETIAPKSSQLNPFSTNIIYRPLVMSEALDQPLEVVIAEKRGAARGRGPRQARGVLASSREDRAAARSPGIVSRRGGRGGRRPSAPREAVAAPTSDSKSIKVSGSSTPTKIAGSIAHVSRAGEPPSVFAIGSSSINQALKGIIIARGYLEGDGVDLNIQACIHQETGRDAIEFELSKFSRRTLPALDAFVLKVASASDPGTVAGAIAGKIRDGSRVALVGLGADAVKNMVKAFISARRFVADDGLDLYMRPEFIEIELDGEPRSAVQMHILAAQI